MYDFIGSFFYESKLYMNPDEFTYDYIKQNVVCLESNHIYRIADSFNLPCSHKINKEILDNSKYDGTILRRYLKKETKDNKDNNMNLSISEYIKDNNIELFDSSHLVVHLRMGDIVDKFAKRHENMIEQINKYLDKNSEISKVVLVTALHYGHPTESNKFYAKGSYSYSQTSHEKNIKVLLKFIKKLKTPVVLQSSEIDVDFSILVSATHLITSNGGFSTLVSKLNKKYVHM